MDTLAYLHLLVQHEADDYPAVTLSWPHVSLPNRACRLLLGGALSAALMMGGSVYAVPGYVVTQGNEFQVEARSGPGIDFDVARTLFEGDAVDLTGNIQDGWAELSDGTWLPVEQVRRSVIPNPDPDPDPDPEPDPDPPTPPVEPEPPQPNPEPPQPNPEPLPPTDTWGKVAQVDAYGYRLNARWGPNTQYGVARILNPSEQIRLSGQVSSNGWVELIDGTWVAGNLIEPEYGGFNVPDRTGSDRLNAVVSAYGYNLNVRSGPGVTYNIVRVLADRQAIEISGRYRDGWAELSDGNWVAGNLIRQVSSVEVDPPSPRPQDISTILRFGSRGDSVVRLQNRLKELNYLGEDQPADGLYGSTTEQAVIEFQRAQGLPVDGVAGETTLAVLFAETTARKPEPQRTLQVGDRIRLVNDGIGGIFVYEQPLTDSRILSTYASGTEATVSQISADGWVALSSGGWVLREFVEF
ncbi:peptidoglycan-binding protein [Sphaerothrix gracilis]|uniref:peptidoglycan-binding protein n=1 Tax=Sphaerothrix gracilis TaxID=3151835 RepID=UPI0031FD5821